MKKINYLLLLSFLQAPSFAYNSNKAQPHVEFYCPQEVICSQGGNINSCKPVGSNVPYWKLNPAAQAWKGVYQFDYAISSYQLPNASMAGCSYFLQTVRGKREISLINARQAYVEASISGSKTWLHQGYIATCNPTTKKADDCPFLEPGILFDKKITASSMQNLKITVSANGIAIKEFDSVKPYEEFLAINYTDALSACGGVQQCRMDVSINASTDNKLSNVGSVMVDMLNDMHIIQVNPTPGSEYNMKKVEFFNTIMFEKTV